MSDEVRFGLIGYGGWGSHHAAAIAKTRGARLVAIASRSSETCERAAANWPETAVHDDLHEFLARDDLDVIDVVLPNDFHYPVAKLVLESGRHLLLEKPMALRTEQCDELIESARSRGTMLAVGHEFRLSNLWGQVKRLIEQGAIGDPQYVLIELARRPYREGIDNWRYEPGRVGSWILEEPIHFFDLARWYLEGRGEPQSVYAAAASRQVEHPQLHDNFTAIVHFPEGAYAVVTQTLAAFEHHQVVKVAGTRGAISASWSGVIDRTWQAECRLRYARDGVVEEIKLERPSGELYELQHEMAMIVDAVKHNRPPAVTGEDGRWSVAMCLAAQRSVETGQVVPLSDFAA